MKSGVSDGISTNPRLPKNSTKRGVHHVYSDEAVRQSIQDQKGAGKSLRAIARFYGFPITHADVERILSGRMPVRVDKRKALNLTPVCLECHRSVPRIRKPVPAWVTEATNNLEGLLKAKEGVE